MIRFILRRLWRMVPALLGVALVTFALVHLAPGDPVQAEMSGEASRGELSDEAVESFRRAYFLDLPMFLNTEINDLPRRMQALVRGLGDADRRTENVRAIARIGGAGLSFLVPRLENLAPAARDGSASPANRHGLVAHAFLAGGGGAGGSQERSEDLGGGGEKSARPTHRAFGLLAGEMHVGAVVGLDAPDEQVPELARRVPRQPAVAHEMLAQQAAQPVVATHLEPKGEEQRAGRVVRRVVGARDRLLEDALGQRVVRHRHHPAGSFELVGGVELAVALDHSGIPCSRTSREKSSSRRMLNRQADSESVMTER